MINTSRCREKTEGWIGRRRTYKCRSCRIKFQVDTLYPLPIEDRYCNSCKRPESLYVFIDKQTEEETAIRASDAELATLRAWKINLNLTFKIPQPKEKK